MRFLIVCTFVLFGSFIAYSTKSSSAVLPAHLPEQLKQAVWRISNHHSATAFFISPRHVVTSWHIIQKNQNMASLSLQQEGNERRLSIKRLISVSALYNLALLETREDSTSHLTVREGVVLDEEELFLLGYPGGGLGYTLNLRYTLKTSHLKHFENDNFIYFSVNRTNLYGNNGGPVLDVNNKVVGVLQGGVSNYIRIIKGSILRKLTTGDIGLNCKELVAQACIKEEINHLHEKANTGNPIAQNELAKMYFYGEGVKLDPSLALEWLQRAAEQGYVQAQNNLGVTYFSGEEGMQQDFSLALKWLQRATKQSYPPAQHSLGVMYFTGKGVQQDSSSALQWFQQAAEWGFVPSQYNLGVMYDEGEGVEPSPSLALMWFRRAAEQGHAPAQYRLNILTLRRMWWQMMVGLF